MVDESILSSSAGDLVRDVTSRKRTCSEVLETFLARIAAVNPAINAICTLDEAGARAQAASLDKALARGENPGPLFGLPIAIKDLVETRGLRTTQGSPLLSDWVPDYDQLFVTRLRDAGAIIIGKTNTPEFGAGSLGNDLAAAQHVGPVSHLQHPGGVLLHYQQGAPLSLERLNQLEDHIDEDGCQTERGLIHHQ